jgi:hypothetical protein
MTTELAPDGRTITFEINNATLLAGTWIFISFLKGVDNRMIDDIKIMTIHKGESSFTYELLVTFVSPILVQEFIEDAKYLLKTKTDQRRTEPRPGFIWDIIERAAKYILKNKAKSMKVHQIEIKKVYMDPKIRDRLLKSDDEEQRRLE